MFLVDFAWFRTFSDDENCKYPPLTGGFMFTAIGLKNHIGIGITAYSIVINLKIGELILLFTLQ